jgi:hypothetical protein
LSSKRNDLGDDKLGNTARVCKRRIEDSNPVPRSIFEVNLVSPNAEATYHDQIFGFAEDPLSKLSL